MDVGGEKGGPVYQTGTRNKPADSKPSREEQKRIWFNAEESILRCQREVKLLVVGLFGEVSTPGRRYIFPFIFYFGEDSDSDSDSEDRRQDSEEKRQDSEEQID